ncbi:hypothetical protein [Microbacterium sp. SL75]|uniref:hypothetical protein n=1 Tax=Microbacterium sp. SL75 TaxID=2995140 RepID=UPI0022712C5C|nr:hypothetical protein [Microbacterium sp. SL75]WAC69234.1 hypothetical protein OVA17_00600 [Microbacterium sp. SL75]
MRDFPEQSAPVPAAVIANHGFRADGRLAGHAARLQKRDKGRLREYVLFAQSLPEAQDIAAASGAELLDTFVINEPPSLGPTVVSDQIVLANATDAPERARSLSASLRMEGRTDRRAVDVMGDEQFWRVLAVTDASPTPFYFATISDRLNKLGRPDRQAFQRAFRYKLRALDDPRWNRAEASDSLDASLALRCEVVAAGETAYFQSFQSPGISTRYADDRWLELAKLVDSVGSKSAQTSAVDIRSGSNEENWSAWSQRILPADRHIPSPGAFSEATQRARARVGPWSRRSMAAFVGYATDGSACRQIVGVLMSANLTLARIEAELFLGSFLRDPWRIPSGISVAFPGIDGPTAGELLASFHVGGARGTETTGATV